MQEFVVEQPERDRRPRVMQRGEWLLVLIRENQLLILLVVMVLQACLYVYLIPPWQHPDEPTHFEHVRMIADTGRLPGPTDVSLPLRKEIAQSMLIHRFWNGISQPELSDRTLSTPYNSPLGVYTLSQPRLYYVVAAVWLRPWLSQPVDTQLYALRLLSMILSVVVVTCAYCSMRWLFPLPNQRYLATAVTAFVIFLPGYADIMSAVNNDALVNALGALSFLLVAYLYTHRQNLFSGLVVLVFMGLTLAFATTAKATAIALIAALPVGLVVALIVRLLLLSEGRRVLRLTLLSVLLLLIAAVIAVVVIYQGTLAEQLTGLSEWLARYLRINMAGTLQSLLNPQRVSYAFTAQIVFQSFWAVFGWRHIYLAPAWYWLPTVATFLALAGIVVWAIRLARQKTPLIDKRRVGQYVTFALIAVGVAWVTAIVRSQADQGTSTPYQSHGRYVYVALVPFAVLFVLGVSSLFPARWRQRASAVLICASFAFQIVCFWGYLFPYYH